MARPGFAYFPELCDSGSVNKKATNAKRANQVEFFDDSNLMIGTRFRGTSGSRLSEKTLSGSQRIIKKIPEQAVASR
jgi:hypothetical protein